MIENSLFRFCMKQAFVILLLLPVGCWAQEIIINEQDTTLKQKRIEIAPLKLLSTSKTKMDISLGAIGPSLYLRLSGSGTGTNIVNVGDKVFFHFDNDSIVAVQSDMFQVYDVEGTTSTYKHIYNLSADDLAKLSRHNLKRLRKYHAEEFDDINIPTQSGRQVKDFSKFLYEELKKMNWIPVDTILVAQRKPQQDSVKKITIEETKPEPANSTAAFPGGEEVWESFLKRNLNAPPELKPNEKKIVLVQFLVNADGSVTNVQIVQSAGPSFDKEVLRVLKRMPYWKPGRENGYTRNSIVTESITFLRDDSSAGL